MSHIVSVHIRRCGVIIVFLAGSVAMRMSNDSPRDDAMRCDDTTVEKVIALALAHDLSLMLIGIQICQSDHLPLQVAEHKGRYVGSWSAVCGSAPSALLFCSST